jgi:hypothetical protein
MTPFQATVPTVYGLSAHWNGVPAILGTVWNAWNGRPHIPTKSKRMPVPTRSTRTKLTGGFNPPFRYRSKDLFIGVWNGGTVPTPATSKKGHKGQQMRTPKRKRMIDEANASKWLTPPRREARERHVVAGLKSILEAEGYHIPNVVWILEREWDVAHGAIVDEEHLMISAARHLYRRAG